MPFPPLIYGIFCAKKNNMTTAFTTTPKPPHPDVPGRPIDVRGPAVGFLQQEVSGVFGEAEIGRRYRERHAAVEAVKRQAAEVDGYISRHSLLGAAPPQDQEVADRRQAVARGLPQIGQQLQRDGFSDRDLDHLLAMGNLASSALASGFEGWSHLRASNWWLQAIGQVNSGNRLFSAGAVPPNVTAALRTLVDSAAVSQDAIALLNPDYVKQHADRFMAGILALRPGESYCLSGGWAGKPSGHAMVYRFERNPAGSFNVYVYNAWDPEVEGGRREEGVLQSRPAFVFENVTSEDLFFTSERPGLAPPPAPNSAMIQRLLELKAEPQPGAKKRGIEDVLNCFCRIKPKLVSGSRFRDLFLRAQRAGNCAIKSVNCLLLDLLGNKTAYKKLILDERLLGLLVYRQRFCQPPFNRRDADGRLDVRTYLRQFALLRRSARNFLTILEKNYKKGVITEAERPQYEQAFATVKGIIDELKIREAEVLQQRKDERGFAPEAIPGTRNPQFLVFERNLRSRGVATLAQLKPTANPPVRRFSVDARLGLGARPPDLGSVIATLRGIMAGAAGSGYHQAAISQFELTVGHLFAGVKTLQGPDGKVRLDGLPPELAPQVQSNLLECLRIYSESVYSQNGMPSTRVQNAGMAAMSLSYALGCWHESVRPPALLSLSQFGIYTEHFARMSRSPEAIYAPLDGAAVEQRNELLAFWAGIKRSTRPGNDLFNFESQKISTELVRADQVPELLLYHGYRPAIEQAGVAFDDQVKGIDQFAQQRVKLFRAVKKEKFPPAMAHIGALKQTALLAFGLFVPGNESEVFEPEAYVSPSGVHYGVGTRSWFTGSDNVINYSRAEEADYPGTERVRRNSITHKDETLPVGRFSDYTANHQHRHIQGADGIRPENALLMETPDVAAERDLALSEPRVQTSLLFEVIEDDLADLSNPDWRARIEAECFKTIDVGGRTVSPLCEQLRDDDALIGKLDRLTDVCLKQLVEANPRDPKWREMLFILRLRANVLANKTRVDSAYRLSRQPPGMNSVAINDRIFAWLRDYDAVLARELLTPGIATEVRDEILQKRRELALTRAGLLLSLPAADLDLADPATGQLDGQLQQRCDLFNLMLMVNKDFQAFSKVESRSFLRECQHRFSARIDIWETVPPLLLDVLGNRIVRNLDAGFVGRPGWSFVAGRLELASGPGSAGYVVDLTRPMVLKNGQELSQATFSVTEEFRRLFESRQFEVRQEGSETISFDDERWGKIYIRGRGADAQIWRLYGRPGQPPKWYLYRRGKPEDLKGHLQINDAICYDHVHWLDVDTKEVLIFDLHDGRTPIYRIKNDPDPDGGPLPVAKLVTCRDEGLEFCLLPQGFNAAIERFDSVGQVNVWSRGGYPGQTGFAHLEFPRFRMQESCLSFDWDVGSQSWVYGADRRFKVSTEPSVPLLDGLSRYLHLVQEEPIGGPGSPKKIVKRKVLIPSGQVCSKGFEEYAAVALKSGENDGNKLSLKYFEYEYDEENDELIPASLEARVYLAHLYLGQKRYQEARAVLKKISMSDRPSPEAVELLQDMLCNGEGLHDLSPNACAIRLYAYLIFKKICPRAVRVERREGGGERVHSEAIDYETIGGDLSEHKTMADVYKAYLLAIRAVEAPLVFDAETELEIFGFLGVGDEFGWRRTDLLREITQHIQAQLPPGAGLTPVQTAALQAVSPAETWEFSGERLPAAWPDLRQFVPTWPFLHTLEDVTKPGNLSWLPYHENYPAFQGFYERIRRASPLEREGMAFDLISDSKRLGFTKEQQAFLVFVAGHSELQLPLMPAETDAAGRWRFCNSFFGQRPPGVGTVPTLEVSLPRAVKLRDEPRTLPPLPAPAVLLPGSAAPVSLVFAGLETQLWGWQEALLDVPTARTATPARGPTPPPGGLSPRESPYTLGAGRELDRYVADRDAASANEAVRPTLKPGVDPLARIPEMEGARDQDKQFEQQLSRSLLDLANRPPPIISQAIAVQIAKEGQARPSLDINTVLRAAATSSAALQKLNPYLTSPEVDMLRAFCLDYMVVKTHRDHVERILKPLISWRDAQLGGRPVNPQWQQDFVDALAQSRTYNPYDARAQDYFPLLFEYMSGMRIWGNQASIIRIVLNAVVEHSDREQQNVVFQRIMAGGKTSVIISALLEVISQSGQLPVVLCHHSQYASVSGNLHNFQESRYDRDVYAIDYDIKQLGEPEMVQEMIAKIQEADRKGCSLLMKSSMPQVIELKFVMEALRLTEIRNQKQEYERRLVEVQAELRVATPLVRQALTAKLQKLQQDIHECDERLAKIMPNVGLLAQVIRTLKAKGVGVLDECDIILSMLMEVNVPIGEEEMLTPERAELVREIYNVLVSDEPLPGAPPARVQPPGVAPVPMSIRDFIGLERNDQAKLSEADFNTLVAPFVAGKLLDNYYESLRLKGMWGDLPAPDPGLRDAFVRYVTDTIPVEAQRAANDWVERTKPTLHEGEELEDRVKLLSATTPQECNLKLLCSIAALANHSSKYKRGAADKIALSGRIIRDVLQLALSRSCDRAYGRDPAHDNGSVIPFLGVNAPATTRFGYVYLALCYQFQAALNKPISVGELRFLAGKMSDAAQDYARKSRIAREMAFEDQPEAKWFFEVTGGAAGGGVRLTDAVKDEAALQRACDQINRDPRRKLKVEAEIAPFHVRYYKERVSSNPINLAEQMRKLFGCSGTPWNWHSYHRKFGELEADRGVEGKILNAMTERASRSGQSYARPSPYPPAPLLPGPPNIYQAITTLRDDGLQPILDHLRHHPQRHRVRALTDAGGFLKGTNNATAAEAILHLHHDPVFCAGQPPAIDAVIYLHQFSAAEVAAGKPREKFVILKRLPDGTERREELPDTSAATIANCGVPKNRIFVLFDELRATGTDIPMAEDTICLQTVDARMPVRTLLQAALRARGYFQEQDCEFLVTARGRSEMINQGANLQDIIDTLIKNQAVADGDQTFRRYLAHITNSVRVAALGEMLGSGSPEAVAASAQRYRSFLVSSFQDNPYRQFAQVEGPRRTEDILLGHARETLVAFYWQRLNLDAAVGPRETLDRALREYVARVLDLNQPPVDRARDLLSRAQRIMTPPGPTPYQYIYLALSKGWWAQDVEGSIRSILTDAKQALAEHVLPPELRYREGAEVDAQVEIEREIEMELGVEEEQEQEVRQELQQQLQEMSLINGSRPYTERAWALPDIAPRGSLDLLALQVIDPWRGGSPVSAFRSVRDVCEMPYAPPVGGKLAQYAGCFPPNLYMTDNLRHTYESCDLPLLHKKMKTANFMLVVETAPGQPPACILLSKKDAVFFKEWIKRCQPSNAWLVDMKGAEEVTNRTRPVPLTNPLVQAGLWAANLFNGNVQYLEDHREQTLQIFDEVGKPLKQKMCDFAIMRSFYNQHRRKTALTSDLIVPSEAVRQKKQGVIFSARRIRLQELYENVKMWDADADWGNLKPDKVRELDDPQLQYLVTPQQVSKLPPSKLRYLQPDQAKLLNPTLVAALRVNVPEELALLRELTDPAMFQHIQDRGFVPLARDEQVPFFPSDQLPLLNNEQIKKLRLSEVSRWPPEDPNIWRLAMVRDEQAVPEPLRQRLRANVNGFSISMADIAGWLIPNLDPAHMSPLAAARRLDEISTNQAKVLDLHLVQHLRRPELIQALQDPLQLREVHQDAAQYLTPNQKVILRDYINGLDGRLLGQLPQWCNAVDLAWPRFRRLTPEEFRALRPDQQQWAEVIVKALNPEQLAQIAASPDPGAPEYLSAHYLPNLTPTQLSGLGDRHRALVARMTKPTLQQLQGRQVDLVPANRLSDLDPGQYRHILDPGLLREAVFVRHLIRRDLRQEQLQRVREVDALLELENVDIGQLLPEQKQMLTEQFNRMDFPALQGWLTARPWAIDLAVWRVLGLPEAEFQFLQATSVGRQITDKLTAVINSQQMPQIKEWLQRGQLPPHYLDFLSQAQLDAADAVVVNMLRQGQIQRLKVPQVKMLIADLVGNRIDQIQPAQVPMLDDGQIQHLRQPALVQVVEGRARIQAVHPDAVQYLTVDQLLAIDPATQAARITEPQLRQFDARHRALANLLPPDQVRLLGPDQVRMLDDPAQINRIRPDQVPMLADDQIQHLREGALVDAVPENKLQLVHIDMAERCWPRFSVLDADRFARLSAAQQRWISETKIPSLTGANLAGLSAAGQLHEHYLRFMTNPQLLALTPAEGLLVSRLPADRFLIITDVAILQTVPKPIQAEKLSDEQIIQLYPRSRAMQVLAGIGSLFAVLGLSLLTFVTLFVLLAIPGYRTWWTLAGAGVGQLGNYVATRRTYLRVS